MHCVHIRSCLTVNTWNFLHDNTGMSIWTLIASQLLWGLWVCTVMKHWTALYEARNPFPSLLTTGWSRAHVDALMTCLQSTCLLTLRHTSTFQNGWDQSVFITLFPKFAQVRHAFGCSHELVNNLSQCFRNTLVTNKHKQTVDSDKIYIFARGDKKLIQLVWHLCHHNAPQEGHVWCAVHRVDEHVAFCLGAGWGIWPEEECVTGTKTHHNVTLSHTHACRGRDKDASQLVFYSLV